MTGVPAEALELGGHVVSSRKEIKLDAVGAKFAGAEAKVDGSIRAGRDRGAAITFAVTAESLARLREGLPEIPFRASGSYTGSRDTRELRDLKATVGKSEISGSARRSRKDGERVEAELFSPRLDLTPLVKKKEEKEKQAEGAPAASGTPAPPAQPGPPARSRRQKSRSRSTSSAKRPWRSTSWRARTSSCTSSSPSWRSRPAC